MRYLVAAGAAALCAVSLGAHTYWNFTPVRIKLIKSPVHATAGPVVLPLPAERPVSDLGSPFAAILSVKNDAGDPRTFQMAFDDVRLCEAEIPGRSTRRVDCAAAILPDAGRPHELSITSTSADWSVEYAEVATHFGSNNQLAHLYVLPAGRHVDSPGPIPAALLFIVVFGIAVTRAPVDRSRVGRVIQASVVALSFVVLAAVVLAPWFTQYRLALTVATCLLFSAGLVLPGLIGLVATARRSERMRVALGSPRVREVVAAGIVAAVLGLVTTREVQRSFQGNYSGFLKISETFFNGHPELSQRKDVRDSLILRPSGYDGMFIYFVAFDPFMQEYRDDPDQYAGFLDLPPYRFSRVGFSLLTRIVSLGRWQWYPATMVWLVVAGVVAAAWILARFATAYGASPFWACLALLIPGFWQSLQMALPEPVAIALILGGYWALTRERWMAACALFAGTLLIRESGLLFVAIALTSVFLSGRRRPALAVLAGSVLPFALWRLYVGLTLQAQFGSRAFFPVPPNLDLPFKGVIDAWQAIGADQYPPGLSSAAVVFSVLLIAALALACYLVWRNPTTVSVAALAYGLLASSFNYRLVWLDVNNAERLTFELFAFLAVSSLPLLRPGTTGAGPIAVRMFWAALVGYLWFASAEAIVVRQALPL